MKFFLPLVMLVFVTSASAQPETIDLKCEDLALQMIQRLSDEGLLMVSDGTNERARSITLDLCSTAQASAQEQHEEGKKKALKNWFLQDTGGKPGNKRLKNLKH